jgi:3alpha(or 20beta)-hydroxysteroid dehydrogenase
MGEAHVRALLKAGARVVGFDIDPGAGPEILAEVGEERFRWLPGDVTSADDWRRIVGECECRFGAPSILVNNAGIVGIGRVDTVSESEYRRVIDVNQVGPVLGMKAVLEPMKRSGGGSIVNISSTSGMVAFRDNFAYVASKWALRGMTKAAAIELAQYGIRVNAVFPGETDTPLLRSDPTALPPEASRFGRWARPEEISAAVVFLASEESSYVSGADVVIDGAHTAE